MTARIQDGKLIIEMPLQTPQPSTSGKTMVVASTRGNVKLPGVEIDGKQVTIGVNAYIPKG